jgi:hypothetical protein
MEIGELRCVEQSFLLGLDVIEVRQTFEVRLQVFRL